MWIGRVRVSHGAHLLNIGGFVDGTAQARFPRRIILFSDAFLVATRLFGPLLYIASGHYTSRDGRLSPSYRKIKQVYRSSDRRSEMYAGCVRR